jgi:streptomycin 6-kinase
MSVVIRCVMVDGRAAVLKVCPDRQRIAAEVAALGRWETDHVPSVHAIDANVGAVLMEAIVPGTMMADCPGYPGTAIAELMRSLQATGRPDPSYPPVRARIADLFEALTRHRAQHPELVEVVSPALFDSGRRLAEHLAEQAAPTVLLHGDLTPVNVLDGGDQRGLVAIDPAPCLGDPAFDAVDLLLWRAEDVATVVARADALAPAIGVNASRLLEWCVAFAGMTASELAEQPHRSDARIATALALAAQAQR